MKAHLVRDDLPQEVRRRITDVISAVLVNDGSVTTAQATITISVYIRPLNKACDSIKPAPKTVIKKIEPITKVTSPHAVSCKTARPWKVDSFGFKWIDERLTAIHNRFTAEQSPNQSKDAPELNWREEERIKRLQRMERHLAGLPNESPSSRAPTSVPTSPASASEFDSRSDRTLFPYVNQKIAAETFGTVSSI